ncbi:hypothetical protein SBA2_1070004 [Acidobacteriia bacterium SbA2]|nr:hypothetical protein SBA2_1070004 [Acidobacteriia bacterium SbA2]
MPNHYVGDLLHTIGISGLSRVRTELFQLAVVQTLAPHPLQVHRQLSSHRHFGDLASTPHRKVKELAAPLGLAAYRNLCRFHQQETQQHVALLADVSQPATIATGLFRHPLPISLNDTDWMRQDLGLAFPTSCSFFVTKFLPHLIWAASGLRCAQLLPLSN